MDDFKVKINMGIKNGNETNKVTTEFSGESARRVIAAIMGEMMGVAPTPQVKETITSFNTE